jgi:hypothetical protein
MVQVSKDEFYKIMNPLDVHPYSQREEDRGDGLARYKSVWKLRNGTLVGESSPGTRIDGGHEVYKVVASRVSSDT